MLLIRVVANEALRTALVKAETIPNNRPIITHVSSDAHDKEAPMPNHSTFCEEAGVGERERSNK